MMLLGEPKIQDEGETSLIKQTTQGIMEAQKLWRNLFRIFVPKGGLKGGEML